MVMAHPVSSGSKFSNESLLERLSCNIFITNFPTTMSAKELWNTCAKYGTLLDVYIPEKMSKMGKRFAFARYHKVYDVDMLIRNLRSVWLGSFHLYANVARFNRDSKSSFSQKLHANEPLNVPRPSFAKVVKGSVIQQRNVAPVMFSSLKQWTSNFEIKDRVVWIDVEGTPLRAWSHATFQKIASKRGELVHMDISNVPHKFSIVRAKEVTGWVPDFVDDNSNEFEVGSDDNVVVIHNWVEEEDDEDPFGLEGLILKSLKKRNVKDVKESTVIPSNFDIPTKDGAKQVLEDNEPKFPPGFTPSNSDLPLNNEKTVQDNVTSPVSMRTSSNRPDFNELGQTKTNQAYDGKSDIESKNKSHGGAKQDHVDSMTTIGGLLQETKMVSLDVFVVKAIWGNMYFDFTTSSARGTWLASNSDLLVIAMGDFNEVCCAMEQYGSYIHKLKAVEFNTFIANSHLIGIPLGGYSFTWSDKDASKMNSLRDIDSRLDKGKGHPDDISCRVNIFRDLMDMDNKAYVNLAQKAKVNGPLRETEIPNTFMEWFSTPDWVRVPFESDFTRRLDTYQAGDLETDVTDDEIKRAV
ncbi:RNA-directed DNA polymerase, eukaryota [Tanacetum coccineum]